MIFPETKTAQIVGRYQKIAWITVGAVLFLILVGALVRMTGSGMGCPDWPKCFGQWVPPTDISQLPADYKVQFAVAGKEIADFDALKTWIEYINRLVGVLIGGFALLTVAFARPLRKEFPLSWRWSIAGLVLVVLQGFLGAYVVRTNLQEGTISLHMFMALLVLGSFLGAALFTYPQKWKQVAKEVSSMKKSWLWLGIASMIVVLAQMLLGTQVREGVDQMAITLGESERSLWLEQIGLSYDIHKIFYYGVVLLLGLAAVQMKNLWTQSILLQRLGLAAMAILALEILLGLSMHHFGIPKILQPLHLLFASLLYADIFSMVLILWLIYKNKND